MSEIIDEEIEQYREILENAPEGANAAIIVEERHYYLRFGGFKLPSEWLDSHKSWVACLSFADVDSIHYLDNLRTIIAQHDRIVELERDKDLNKIRADAVREAAEATNKGDEIGYFTCCFHELLSYAEKLEAKGSE